LMRFLDHTVLDTLTGTPLNEWSTRRRVPCLHNQHNKQTSMPSAGFKPAIPAVKRPQTYALDCTANKWESRRSIQSIKHTGSRLTSCMTKANSSFAVNKPNSWNSASHSSWGKYMGNCHFIYTYSNFKYIPSNFIAILYIHWHWCLYNGDVNDVGG
jgi:hypothetical protein